MAALLRTIGYQEATPDAVLGTLKAAGVDLLVDVRAVAASRRPGFSKRQLAAGAEAAGIGYLHLRGLGTPAEGRLAARTGRYDDLRRIYGAHLETEGAQAELEDLRSVVESGRQVCLLCFERHPEHCHRTMVAEALAARTELVVDHLLP